MPSESNWTMATGEDDGKPLIFRIRNRAPSFATSATFPHLLALTWQFDPTSNNGLPLSDALERMLELENVLEPAFANARQAFLTVVVTGNGVREWQWYAKDPDEIMKLVNEVLGEKDPFPIEICFQDDPNWMGYSRYLGIVQSETEADPLPNDGHDLVF